MGIVMFHLSRRSLSSSVVLALPLLYALAAQAPAAPSFTIVTSGELSGRFKLSGDGSTLAYSLGNNGTFQSYRWRREFGSDPIPFAQGTTVEGISRDGSVVMGVGNGGVGT